MKYSIKCLFLGVTLVVAFSTIAEAAKVCQSGRQAYSQYKKAPDGTCFAQDRQGRSVTGREVEAQAQTFSSLDADDP